MNNKISIAMATYNGENYLREQLDSLYAQTYIPDEIVVVDDCSTDNTKIILEEYHQKYGLIYYINESTLGVNKNFEKSLSLCSNNYISICDQDDVWLPHKIETIYKKLLSIESDLPALVSSTKIDVDAGLNKIETTIIDSKDSDSYSTTLLGHHSSGCTMMMNRALLKYILPIPSDSKMLYDIYIGLIAAMVGNKYNIAEPLMYYRHHASNVCGQISNEKESFLIRLKNRYSNRYPKLVSDGRLYNMKIVADLKSQYFIPQRAVLYYKILSLDQNINILKKIRIIFSVKELSVIKRCIAIWYMIISLLFRMILKVNHNYKIDY